jgi:peptide chain release factor subunit 1
MAADTSTRARLRRLAELRPERGRVLSVFLNLDPSEFALAPARATEINSVMTDAARRVDDVEALGHDDKRALRDDLERIRQALQASDIAADGTQGVAVYACAPAGLFELVRLPHPIETRAAVDFRPVLEPLLRSDGDERWAVLLANRQTARIFAGTAESLEESDRITDDVHAQHDQGGWSQLRYQRSIEQDVLRHLAHAADTLFARFKRRPFDHLLVGAPQELAGDVEQRLHPYLKERLAGRLSVDVENAAAEDVQAAAAAASEQHVAALERAALDRLAAGIGRGERAAAGADAVHAALEQARVEILLLAGDFDGEGRDEAIELAVGQSAQVLIVRHHDDLVLHGGIGAVLRF